ncbi:MAG: hypothetical protein QNL91_09210, partial [Candidatus Krumholzibacteria bacterium]|nr:hypothetical protein [Candidatus Krumholzibacteria bacterium]
MRSEKRAQGTVGHLANSSLSDQSLDCKAWDKAWSAFLAEDYTSSLKLTRTCLDKLESGDPAPVALVPDPGSPTVK